MADVVSDAITRIPPFEQIVDPYSIGAGQPVRNAYDYSYHADGRIEFGDKFEDRRLFVGQYELMYAQSDEKGISAVVIHKFKDGGGFESRTWFEQKEYGISKKYETSPNSMDFGPGFHRLLDQEEESDFLSVVSCAKPTEDQLAALTDLNTTEQVLLAERAAQIKASEEKFAADMEAIRQAERSAWQDDNGIILG